MESFGVMTTALLDTKYLIFGTEIEDEGGETTLPTQDPDPDPDPVVYEKNVIASLDLETLAEKETNKNLKKIQF